MPDPQYVFRHGLWCDQWNDRYDIEPSTTPWWEGILGNELCGCAAFDLVGRNLARLLLGDDLTDLDPLGRELLMALADRLGFTDHGSNMTYAWTTPAGTRWLALYLQDRPRRSEPHDD